VFDLDDVDAIARFVLAQATRCRYQPFDRPRPGDRPPVGSTG
jgi:hypothetical protein